MNRKQHALIGSLLALLMIAPATLYASESDTLIVDLETALKIAMGSSPEAIRTEFNEQSAELNLRSARYDLFSPEMDLRFMTPSYQEANVEDIVFNVADSTRTLKWVRTISQRYQGDLTILQPLPTGGQIRLESTFYQRFYDSDFSSNDQKEYSANWRLSVDHEFLRGNPARTAKKVALLSYQRTKHNGIRTRQNLAYTVLESYYSLLSTARELEISRDDLNASSETAEMARRKFEAGFIPEVEALQLEVEVAQKEAELSRSIAGYEAALDRFRVTLGLDLTLPMKITGKPSFEMTEVKLDSAIAFAMAHREDRRIEKLDLEQAKIGLKNAKRPYRPSARVNAFYSYERRDEEYNKVLNSRIDDYDVNRGAAVTLSLPLYTGGRRKISVQSARLALRETEFNAQQSEKNIILEVRDAVRNVLETKERYNLTLKSQQIAEASYAITKNRFENGQVTARVWIEAQLTLKRNRINALRSLIDHNLAVARYRLTIGKPVHTSLETFDLSTNEF